MNNPRLAGRYAKSLLDLALEQNQVDAVYADMKWLKSVHKSNADFVAVLRSPVIKPGIKGKIISSIIIGRVSQLTEGFVTLLVRKGRETNLPEIVDAFIEQFNALKDINTVKITTATPLSDQLKEAILANVKTSIKGSLEIETTIDEDLIGGFVLETNGQLVDASVLRDLKDIKNQFLKNDYIHRIR